MSSYFLLCGYFRSLVFTLMDLYFKKIFPYQTNLIAFLWIFILDFCCKLSCLFVLWVLSLVFPLWIVEGFILLDYIYTRLYMLFFVPLCPKLMFVTPWNFNVKICFDSCFSLLVFLVSLYVTMSCLFVLCSETAGRFRFLKATECGPLNTWKVTMPVTSLGLWICFVFLFYCWFIFVCCVFCPLYNSDCLVWLMCSILLIQCLVKFWFISM